MFAGVEGHISHASVVLEAAATAIAMIPVIQLVQTGATHTFNTSPAAYQVIPEPGIGQFRESEPRRVLTRIHSLGLFLADKLACGKRESVS